MNINDVDIEALLGQPRQQQPEQPTFASVPIADVLSRPEPLARFVWGSRIPRNYVTLLGAHGGTGKSVFSLQLASCVAMGLPCLGGATERGKVLFWSAEDGTSTVRQRLANIVTHYHIDPEYLAEWLEVIDATSHPTLYQEVMNESIREGATTQALDYLRGLLSEQHSLLVVDNASDVFDANENERKHVRGFVRSLARLASDFGIGVLLLGHIQKAAAERGSSQSYSGSSAWHNSARSRLAMTKDGKTGEIVLTHDKCNVGALSPSLPLAFTLAGLLVEAAPIEIELDTGGPDPEMAVLTLLADYERRGEPVSTAEQSRGNAFKVLSTEPTFPGKRIDKPDLLFALFRSMERQGYVTRETYKRPNRTWGERFNLTATGYMKAGIVPPAPTAPTAPTAEVEAVNAVEAVTPPAGCTTAPTAGLGGTGDEIAHPVDAEVDAVDAEERRAHAVEAAVEAVDAPVEAVDAKVDAPSLAGSPNAYARAKGRQA